MQTYYVISWDKITLFSDWIQKRSPTKRACSEAPIYLSPPTTTPKLTAPSPTSFAHSASAFNLWRGHMQTHLSGTGDPFAQLMVQRFILICLCLRRFWSLVSCVRESISHPSRSPGLLPQVPKTAQFSEVHLEPHLDPQMNRRRSLSPAVPRSNRKSQWIL